MNPSISLTCFLLTIIVSLVNAELVDYKVATWIFDQDQIGYLESSNSKQINEFISFMKKYNKTYQDITELYERFDNFKTNLQRIEYVRSINTGTAVYEMNEKADLSSEDLYNRKCLNMQGVDLSQIKTDMKQYINMTSEVPSSFDWRDQPGVIGEMKDQKFCCSCYAFSAVGVVEAMYAIQNKETVVLSEQQIVDCDTLDHGCRGGNMINTMTYIHQVGGIETQADYRYTGDKGDCEATPDNGKKRYTIKSFERFASVDENHMKKYIAQNGPLSVALNAILLHDDYKEGIIDSDMKHCNSTNLNHGVIIVGYGVEQNNETSVPYWIVRNSWGTTWGDKGYFKIRRGKNVCGIAELVISAQV